MSENSNSQISTNSTNRNPKNSRVGFFEKLFKPTGGRKTLKDLDLYVRFSIFVAIVFSIIVLILFAITGTEPSTLITCFFAMFGGEVFFCAMIKLFKLKEKKEDEEDSLGE